MQTRFTYSRILLIILAIVMAIPCTIKEDLKLEAPLEAMQPRAAKTVCELSVATKPTANDTNQQQAEPKRDLRLVSSKSNWRIAKLHNKQLPKLINKPWYAKPPTYLLNLSFLI